jgi:hypothetical protein
MYIIFLSIETNTVCVESVKMRTVRGFFSIMERLVSFYRTSYVHSRGVSCSFPVLCMTTYRGWRSINFQKSAQVCFYGVLRWYDRYVL